MKKILALILCLCLMIPFAVSCSRPPEYAEIEARLKELVEASYQVNVLLFGDGLPTYERVYDPRSTTDVFKDEANGKIYYFYEFSNVLQHFHIEARNHCIFR